MASWVYTDLYWGVQNGNSCAGINRHEALILVSWVKGSDSMRFGGEQRVFYNNLWQPYLPNSEFHFAQHITAQQPYSGDTRKLPCELAFGLRVFRWHRHAT